MSKSSHNENMRGDAESIENSPLFLIEAEWIPPPPQLALETNEKSILLFFYSADICRN